MSKSELTSETICRQHLGLIRKVIAARRVRDPDIDDVAQETLIAIHRSLRNHRSPYGTIEAWVSSISWRVATQHLKRELRDVGRRAAGDGELAHLSLPDPASNGEERLMEDEERRFLQTVLARMPDNRREAFELYALCGLTQADVAQVLSVPESTVQSWIRLAWNDMNAALKKRRAEERRGRAMVLPISAAALIERERARTRDASEEEIERMVTRLRRALDEARAGEQEAAREEEEQEEQEHAARTPFEPNLPLPASPRRSVDMQRLMQGLTASGVAGAAGGLIVWALLHGGPAPVVTLPVVGSAVPSAGQLASPPAGAGTAPSAMVTPATLTTSPSSAAPSHGVPGAATSSLIPSTPPSASRQTAPLSPDPVADEQAAEALMRAAKEALARGDTDTARARLNEH